MASVSVEHPAGALAIICCWVLLTWLTYAIMACFVKMTLLPESFYSSNVHAIILGWAHQLIYVHDQLPIVISSSGMFAMLGIGSGPSKLW